MAIEAVSAAPPAAGSSVVLLSGAPIDVDRSLSGRRWVWRAADARVAMALAQRLGVDEVVGRILAGRGVGLDAAERFLDPTLREMLPEPFGLADMEAATERLAAAVIDGERIGILGDYDVDGATSAALLIRFFAAAGGRTRLHVPDRIAEGYGPNTPALLALGDAGVSIVVTVDCGTGAHEPLEAAARAGLDVIVVDHHAADSHLPRAFAVVNPKRLDDRSGQGQLAAVGVAFLLVVAVNRALREAGWYAARPEPDLTGWLDLVALGTVCDVVPLVGVNRALVRQGLRTMGRRRNAGLRALADVAGLDAAPGTYHVGFVLGPRVNAGGRVGRSDLGARLLASDDPVEALELARRLDAHNRERREIEAAVLEAALARIEGAAEAHADALVFVAGEGWHPGVIGIVAGRLKERYHRPACVVAIAGDVGVGSGRSIDGVDLGAMIIAARQAGLLQRGGGHSMAAGFTVSRERMADLAAFLQERTAARMTEAGLVPLLHLDGTLRPDAVTAELVSVIGRIGPFGSGNPEPRFAIPGARVTYAQVVGDGHVRCAIAGDAGGGLKAIAFRSADTPLGAALLRRDGAPHHLAVRVRLDTWGGRERVEMHIDDAAPVW